MFKVLQTDPETSAIQINQNAVLQCRDWKLLLDVFARVFGETPQDLIQFLRGIDDQDCQSRLAGFASSLLHEIRHYLDLVFTPYGFYRLRVAFEFYNNILTLLVDGRNSQIPVPLMSGAHPVNQQLLGLSAYAQTPLKKFSDIALSRMLVLLRDNRKYSFSTGLESGLGGDATLEALAYTVQSEWLVNVFDTPACRKRHARFFDDYAGSGFDLKYRWYLPLTYTLNRTPTPGTARLAQCMMFASLFGSFAKNANYIYGDEVLDSERGRYIDECLPSYRLSELFFYFKNRDVPDNDNERWSELYNLVDQACYELWGRRLIEEIEADIQADTKLISSFEATNRTVSNKIHPFRAFRDLIETRVALLDKFREDPIPFVSPVSFITQLSPLLRPPLIHVYPKGLRDIEQVGSPVILTVRTIKYDEDNQIDEEGTHQEEFVYSFWFPSDNGELNRVRNVDAWQGVFALFGPLYKGLLYGHKYRSMLEWDIVSSLNNKVLKDRLVWDPDYLEARDVSPPDEYFEFFDLTSAQCDMCGTIVDRSNSVLISSLTVKQSTGFVEHFAQLHKASLVTELLLKDWSVWLFCLPEARKWGFVR